MQYDTIFLAINYWIIGVDFHLMKERNGTTQLLLLAFPWPESTLFEFPRQLFHTLRRESKTFLEVHYSGPLYSGVYPRFYESIQSAPLDTKGSSVAPLFLFVGHF